MICCDFFNHTRLTTAFSQLYGLNKDDVVCLAIEAMQHEDYALYFTEQAKLLLDTIDVSDVYLHCKHITTSIDRLESFRKNGFLTLNESLTKKTPLSVFLKKHNITVDVASKIIYYREKCLCLYDSEEECRECFFGAECQHRTSIFSGTKETSTTYRDLACEFRKSIKVLRSKLYHDMGEIEVFLSGEDKDIHGYSEVKRHPEVLYTIERLINKLFENKVTLQRDWEDCTDGKYYCLDFNVSIFDFERITTPNDRYFYTPYLDYCHTDYSSTDEVNANFLANVFILNSGIPCLAFDGITIYGQILPETKIPFDCIEFTEYSTNN